MGYYVVFALIVIGTSVKGYPDTPEMNSIIREIDLVDRGRLLNRIKAINLITTTIDDRVCGITRKVLKTATGPDTAIVDKLNDVITYILELMGRIVKMGQGKSEHQLRFIYYVRDQISDGLAKLKSDLKVIEPKVSCLWLRGQIKV